MPAVDAILIARKEAYTIRIPMTGYSKYCPKQLRLFKGFNLISNMIVSDEDRVGLLGIALSQDNVIGKNTAPIYTWKNESLSNSDVQIAALASLLNIKPRFLKTLTYANQSGLVLWQSSDATINH